MKHLFQILLFVLLPLGLLAQDDDPFASPSGNDDPFANPSPQPTEQPQEQPQNQEPVQNEQPTDNQTDPFGNDTTEDPFGEDTSGDPFGGSDSGDLGDMFGGGGAPSGDILSGLSDTIIQPLRPEYPWTKQSIEERQVFEKHNVREADVFWAKTIWREIDVREKMNHPFINPQAPFMTVLLDIIKKDTSVQLYSFDPFVDAEFQDETSWAEINEGLGSTRTIDVPIMDDQGNITTERQTITDKFNIGSVKRFRVKEVWYFDKVRSRMKVAIMGIAPIKETTLADLGVSDITMDLGSGSGASQDPLFWVYYPDIREQLARYETYNPLNDAIRMSWDDLIQARFFSSFIIKASNPLDRYVDEYTRDNLAALYESENIKEEIFNFEHDLWSY